MQERLETMDEKIRLAKEAIAKPAESMRIAKAIAHAGLCSRRDAEAWIADLWATILGASVSGVDDDFFAHGGGSLAAAQLVSSLRTRFPQVTVADVYAHPRLGDLADLLVDAIAPLAESGFIWLLTPKRGRDGYVEPSDIAEAAAIAGLSQTTVTTAGTEWSAARLAGRRAGGAKK